jgi:hypothetical protein
MNFEHKYLKYKIKYLELKKLMGGQNNLKKYGFTSDEISILNKYLDKSHLKQIEDIAEKGETAESILNKINIINHMEWMEKYKKDKKTATKSGVAVIEQQIEKAKDQVAEKLENYFTKGPNRR